MAYTASGLVSTIWGNKVIKFINVTADAASGSVVTGLSNVDVAMVQNVSAATAAFKVKVNLSAASAALLGSVMISSAVSGDNFVLVAIGR